MRFNKSVYLLCSSFVALGVSGCGDGGGEQPQQQPQQQSQQQGNGASMPNVSADLVETQIVSTVADRKEDRGEVLQSDQVQRGLKAAERAQAAIEAVVVARAASQTAVSSAEPKPSEGVAVATVRSERDQELLEAWKGYSSAYAELVELKKSQAALEAKLNNVGMQSYQELEQAVEGARVGFEGVSQQTAALKKYKSSLTGVGFSELANVPDIQVVNQGVDTLLNAEDEARSSWERLTALTQEELAFRRLHYVFMVPKDLRFAADQTELKKENGVQAALEKQNNGEKLPDFSEELNKRVKAKLKDNEAIRMSVEVTDADGKKSERVVELVRPLGDNGGKVTFTERMQQVVSEPLKGLSIHTAASETSDGSLLHRLLQGDLDQAADVVFNGVYRDALRLKYSIDDGLLADTTEYYSLSELRSLVKIAASAGLVTEQGVGVSGKEAALEALAETEPDLLKGKKFPYFNGKKTYVFPTIAYIEGVEAAFYGEVVDEIRRFLITDLRAKKFFPKQAASATTALSAGLIGNASRVSYRGLRQDGFGANASGFMLNGFQGDRVEFNLPVRVSLHGKVESGKSVDTTGSVSTKFGNTLVGISQAYVNTGAGFKSESLQTETSVMVGQKLGAAFAEVQLGSVDAKGVNKADFTGSRTQVTLGVDTTYVTPFVQLTHRNLDRQGLLMKSNVSDTTVALGAEVDIAKHTTDAYQVDLNVSGKVGYNSKSWTAYGKDLGTDTGVTGSLEMKGSLKLNTGVTFSSNLSFGSVAGSSAGLNLSLER